MEESDRSPGPGVVVVIALLLVLLGGLIGHWYGRCSGEDYRSFEEPYVGLHWPTNGCVKKAGAKVATCAGAAATST